MQRPAFRLSCVLIASGLATGCVSAPKATVELAEVVEEQLHQLQKSHESFVRLYYDKLRREVDVFMEQKWIPKFLTNVVQGAGEQSKEFRKQLDAAYKLATLDWRAALRVTQQPDADIKKAVEGAVERLIEQESAKLGHVLLDFSKAVQKQILLRRASLLEPIAKQEALVLEQLRDTYADTFRGAATLKAYLGSVVKLVEKRDEVLGKIGMLEKQRKLVDLASGASDAAARVLRTAQDSDSGIEGFLELLGSAEDEIKALLKGKE